MNRWKEKVALVTGADNVIGIEIVKVLAKNGMKVIASAEIRNEVEELAANIKREYKIEIYPIACDLRKEEDILNMIKWADEKLNGIDVLINNASVSCKESIIGNCHLFFLFHYFLFSVWIVLLYNILKLFLIHAMMQNLL